MLLSNMYRDFKVRGQFQFKHINSSTVHFFAPASFTTVTDSLLIQHSRRWRALRWVLGDKDEDAVARSLVSTVFSTAGQLSPHFPLLSPPSALGEDCKPGPRGGEQPQGGSAEPAQV